MRKWKVLCCLLCVGLLAACGTKQANLPFDGGDLAAKLGQGYAQKVETALFILDASSSMFDESEGAQKFSTAKNLLLRMNAAMAGLKLDAGLQVFGPQGSKLAYGLKPYEAKEFAAAVSAVQLGGTTPMSRALADSIESLKASKGRIAVIVVSDGLSTSASDPVQAATELKNAYGDRICIHTVLVGNDPKGKATMEAIAKASGCGLASTAATLASGSELAGFLEKVFLEKAQEAAAKPAPAPAPAPERIVLRGINFDFEQAVTNLKVVVEGHTCDLGSDAYNQKLSERRAKAVYGYLVKKGVSAASLSTVGRGETQPMADNKTQSGRELNRRVEFAVQQ